MGVFDVFVQFAPAGAAMPLPKRADDRLTVIGLNVEHAIENARAAIRESLGDDADPSVRVVILTVTLVRVLD